MEKQLENPLYANLPERLEAIKELGAIWARSGPGILHLFGHHHA